MSYRIVLAEDNKSLGQVIAFRLRREGWQVIWELDGAAALDSIITKQPDLIILDIMMPVMDGYEVLERVKRLEATRNTPVIILTARGEREDVLKGISLHADDYLVKPFSSNDLAVRVKKVLGDLPPRKREDEGPDKES